MLLGESAPNTTYLGQRLLYSTKPEPSFDPLSNTRYLLEMAKHSLMYGALWAFGGFVSFIVFFVVVIATRSFRPVVIWYAGGGISWWILTIVFLFRPIPAQLSEWKFSIDGKGAAASSAFNQIIWSLQNRHTPIPPPRIRRIVQSGVPSRDYLEIRDNIFLGFVSCFPYGDDLYIGWTFWLSLSPFRWVLTGFARMWQAIRFQVNELYISLRYESAQALREAMHSAAREGIDIAVGYIPASGYGTVGSALQVDVTTLSV